MKGTAVKIYLIVPQCCSHCTREQNFDGADIHPLRLQKGQLFNRSDRRFGPRQFEGLHRDIGLLGYPVWIECDDPATVRRVLDLPEGDPRVIAIGAERPK